MRHAFVHIGDIHLHPGPRQEDRVRALDQIIDHGIGLDDLAAWLIPGDIFHTKSTIEDRNIFVPRLQRMADHAPVVIVRGNHDAPGDLDILGAIKAPYPVFVVTTPETVRFKTPTEQPVSIACLPYPYRAELVGEGLAPEEVGEVAAEALDVMLMVLQNELQVDAIGGAITLAAAHINVGGSESSTGQPQIGREIELAPGHIARMNVGYFALNHIHKHQALHGAVYAGSICRLDFGENEPKGFIVATFDHESDWTWEFIDLKVPNQLTVVGHLSPESFTTNAEQSDDLWLIPGSDVRVRYTYDRAQASLIDTTKVIAFCKGARSLKLEPQPIHEAEVRAPEIAAAKTLEEKVRAYCTRMNIAWTEGLAEKVAAMQKPIEAPMEVDA